MADNASANGTDPTDMDRAFLRIAEGQVHYRHAGQSTPAAPYPLYVAHAGPSPASFAGLAAELGRSRRVIAPDRLGVGDSAAPAVKTPDIRYFADVVVREMDALGIDKADYFGSHTGAYMGVELLIHRPDRVRRAVFDGLSMRPDDLQQTMLDNYAPEIAPDEYGRQFTWAFQYVRDQNLHFPHFMRDPAHYSHRPMSSAAALHKTAVEILKSIATYHMGYRAVFSHDTGARLPLIEKNVVPLMVMTSEEDGEHQYLDDIARRLPWARKVSVPGGWGGPGVAARAKAIADFLDG